VAAPFHAKLSPQDEASLPQWPRAVATVAWLAPTVWLMATRGVTGAAWAVVVRAAVDALRGAVEARILPPRPSQPEPTPEPPPSTRSPERKRRRR